MEFVFAGALQKSRATFFFRGFLCSQTRPRCDEGEDATRCVLRRAVYEIFIPASAKAVYACRSLLPRGVRWLSFQPLLAGQRLHTVPADAGRTTSTPAN
jgi:hypothetical protein